MIDTIMGITVGALFMLAGFVVSLTGVSGSVQWVVKTGNIASRLTNATPGVFFALLGAGIVWRYKPKGSTIDQDGDTRSEERFDETTTEQE